jgi:flagellar basal body-associated protein FliL
MGQQQLLLIILVTVIVALATVVAVNTFRTAAEEANYDAIRQDILQAQAMASGYIRKPLSMNGGGGSYENITLNTIGMLDNNENASYEIGVVNPESFQIIATSDRGFKVTATIEGDAITWLREDE